MPASPPRGLSAAPSARHERFAPGEEDETPEEFLDVPLEPLWKRLHIFDGGGEVFDEKEAEAYYVELQVACGVACEALDKFITKTTADGTEAYIWRKLIDQDMLGPIAESWVTIARQRPEVAQVARHAVVVAAHYEAGTITLGAFVATLQHWARHGFTLWIPFAPNLKALRFGRRPTPTSS